MANTTQTLLGTGIGIAAYAATTLFSSPNPRFIGNIIAPCVIQERHHDQMVYTQHPTENGTIISDHKYKLPLKLDIDVVYSLSQGNNALNLLGNAAATVGNLAGVSLPKYPTSPSLQKYYEQFVTLMNSQILFDVNTGKRFYRNMQIESIELITNKDTENLDAISLHLTEIIVVTTSTTETSSVNMTNPANNASPETSPTQSLSTPSSTLSSTTTSAIGG